MRFTFFILSLILFSNAFASDYPKVPLKDDPQMKRLTIYMKKYGYRCSGVLINPNTVLTVAHCPVIKRFNDSNAQIIVNAQIYSEYHQSTIAIARIKSMTPHPDFELGNPDAGPDLAVVKLTGDVDFVDGEVVLDSIANNFVDQLLGKDVHFAGFGKPTRNTPSGGNIKLIAVEGKKQDGAEMPTDAPNGFKHHAMSHNIEKTWCSGDSGGPVYIREDDKLFLVGLVSFRVFENPPSDSNQKCKVQSGVFGVFSLIKGYREFIDSVE